MAGDASTYEVSDFSSEHVIEIFDSVKEGTPDATSDLSDLATELRSIARHAAYLAQQCEDRVEELEGESEDDGD